MITRNLYCKSNLMCALGVRWVRCRSHMVLLAGTMEGGLQALVRLRFGIDAQRSVAMNMTARATSAEVSEAVHMIISEG